MSRAYPPPNVLRPSVVRTNSEDTKIGAIGLVCLAGGAFFCPLNSVHLVKGLLTYSDAFFLLALFLRIPSSAAARFHLGAGYALIAVSSALLMVSGLMPHITGQESPGMLNVLKLIYSLSVFPLMVMFIIGDDLRGLNLLLKAWLLGAAFSALVALASSHGVSLLGFFDAAAARGGRGSGLSYHPNVLGFTSALALPVSAYFIVRDRGVWKLGNACLGLLCLYGLQSSGSRSAMLALGVALFVFLASFIRRQMPVAPLVGGLCLVFGLAFAVLIALAIDPSQLDDSARQSTVGRILNWSSVSYSNAHRTAYAQYGLQQFLDNPLFGTGYSMLRFSHNTWITLLQCGGLLGVSAYLMWLLGVLIILRQAFRQIKNSQKLRLSFLGLVIMLVNGLFQPILVDRNGYLFVAVLFVLNAQRNLYGTLNEAKS